MSTKRREYEYGRIVSVDVVPLGDNLAADVAIGASSITVEDAADFDESGGQLLLGALAYAYTTWTEDDSTGVGTITLATGVTLTVAANEGDAVSVYDPLYQTAATDKVAQIEVVGDDGNVDMLEASVAMHLVDKVSEGVRGVNGEQVKLELEGDEWVVVDVFGLSDSAKPGAPGSSLAVRPFEDTMFLAATGVEHTMTLSFEPISPSEHLFWEGVYQPSAEWSRLQNVVTIRDPLQMAKVGDLFTMEYLILTDATARRYVTATQTAYPAYNPNSLVLTIPGAPNFPYPISAAPGLTVELGWLGLDQLLGMGCTYTDPYDPTTKSATYPNPEHIRRSSISGTDSFGAYIGFRWDFDDWGSPRGDFGELLIDVKGYL